MVMQATSAIQVTARFNPLNWVFALCTPHVVVDGQDFGLRWGTHLFPVAPGRHEVRVYIPYIFWPRCGENGAVVDVGPGQVVQVRFVAPFFATMRGELSVQLAPAQAVPAGPPPPGAPGEPAVAFAVPVDGDPARGAAAIAGPPVATVLVPPAPPSDAVALWSMLLGFLGIMCFPTAPVALGLGAWALSRGQSKGMAISGIVLGALISGFWAFAFVLAAVRH